MIEAADISVSFRRGLLGPPLKALDGFSVRIEKGDIFGILGPNGAGKSTAMYCFLGLIKPDNGSVRVFGQEPSPGAALFERVAYVPEEPHYHLYLTVEEALSYYASLYRREVPKSKVNDLITRVGLLEFKDLKLEKCSKGMKQKVGIAACLLNDPELVFLDEPTRGLDPLMVRESRDILLEMNRRGATIVLNSHVLSEVEMVCNRVAIMDRGKVVASDELRNLLTVDTQNYSVAFDAADDLPPFITMTDRSGGRVKGLVPVAKLQEFIAFAGEKGLNVYECALRQTTLEDAFVRILGKG